MIIDPDFLTHWKTRALVAALDDEKAPLYVLAMWAYCQHRRTHILPSSKEKIRAICGAPQNADNFISAMLGGEDGHGFIDATESGFRAHDWLKVNAGMISRWKNGSKSGGRPRKPDDNREETGASDAGYESDTPRPRKRRGEERNTPPTPSAEGDEGVGQDAARKPFDGVNGTYRAAFVALKATGKVPGLTYEILAAAAHACPKARLDEPIGFELLVRRLSGVVGTVNDTERWMMRAASDQEADMLRAGGGSQAADGPEDPYRYRGEG